MKKLIASLAVGAALTTVTALPAAAAYYDSRANCHAVGSLGSWRANGFDSRGNKVYTGPKRTFKFQATSNCVDWLSVT